MIFSGLRGDALQRECRAYLAKRTGTYDFRMRRYREVMGEMLRLGLKAGDHVIDLGAGMCEFDYYLRSEGWHGIYVPVDGVIDGTNLNDYLFKPADFYVAIEVLEHLDWTLFIRRMMRIQSRKGAVITTPNADRVDVLAMDETHINPLRLKDFVAPWQAREVNLFGHEGDTIVAWTPGGYPK